MKVTEDHSDPRYRSYVIHDDYGVYLASGAGFATREYMDRSISLVMRQLLGQRPAPVQSPPAMISTVKIVESWTNRWYGKERA